ncbi:MAG: hypothetical protein GY810_17215 [Aureispira sp.]|nr:hypothetical protein [Aureispira sp.]
MKLIMMSCLALLLSHAQAQINQPFSNPYYNSTQMANYPTVTPEINADDYSITIHTKVLYNATPDGYHVTFSKSFISQTVAGVEHLMNTKTDSLIQSVRAIDISKKDVLMDIVALDPIFDLNIRDTIVDRPIGYKITQNLTFRIRELAKLRRLSKICLDYNIYDLVKVQAYLNNSKPILDSLSQKSVEILEIKKKLSEDIGWTFTKGKTNFKETKHVFYPNERYLKSLASNDNLYQHQLSQNSAVNYNRQVNINNHYTYNHKHADFVFHAAKSIPVIQFYYELTYWYKKVDPEEEELKKEAKEERKKEKSIYILDDNGSLKKVEIK